MDYKVDFGLSIKFADKDGTQIFHEGDNVVCCVGDKNIFAGKIISIGNHQKNKNVEPERVICIDTSKSETSYSTEMIRVRDITYISRYSLDAGEGSEIAEAAGIYIELLKRCRDMSLKVIEIMADVYNEAIANGMTDIPEFSDVLALITENMENVLDKEKIVKIIRGTNESVA